METAKGASVWPIGVGKSGATYTSRDHDDIEAVICKELLTDKLSHATHSCESNGLASGVHGVASLCLRHFGVLKDGQVGKVDRSKTNHGDRMEKGGVLHILTIAAEAMAMIPHRMAKMACSTGTGEGYHEYVRGLHKRQE